MTAVMSYALILAHLLSGLPFAVVPATSRTVDSPPSAKASVDVKARQGNWMHSWEEAVAASKKQQLPLVVHFEATWCGPCRRMASNVLDRNEVKSLLGNNVLGVRLDADQNRALIDEYDIATLPTELVLAPNGTEKARFVGAETMANYVSRLKDLSHDSKADAKTAVANTEKSAADDANEEETRSCLIVRRDGKIVGLGGFSPVALKDGREWKAGSEEFVAAYQDVEYFLQSTEEVRRFQAAPESFVPHLHGCDLVELHDTNEAKTGVIELGSFYKGEMFFFANSENRQRFQNNPSWYLAAYQPAEVEDGELSPLVRSAVN